MAPERCRKAVRFYPFWSGGCLTNLRICQFSLTNCFFDGLSRPQILPREIGCKIPEEDNPLRNLSGAARIRRLLD